MIQYRDNFDIPARALEIPLTTAAGYASGINIGYGLGLNENSQRTLGRMSALNAGLMSTSNLLNTLTRSREQRRRLESAQLDEYTALPYDQYAYDYFSNTQYDGNYFRKGGIPQRYKNKGFTKVGQKRRSTRPGKKWMVLAKKGDKYKIVHGGDKSMQDFSQHKNKERKKRFWDRMGGKNGPKARDPFSPLYWHKRFGTW